jgi:hypothetical protein
MSGNPGNSSPEENSIPQKTQKTKETDVCYIPCSGVKDCKWDTLPKIPDKNTAYRVTLV